MSVRLSKEAKKKGELSGAVLARSSKALIQATGLLFLGVLLGILSREIRGLDIPWSGG